MKIILTMFLFSLAGSILWSQKKTKVDHSISLGDSIIKINQHYHSKESKILFVNVHEDEQTSIEAMHMFSEEIDVNFVFLEHIGTRRVNFNIKNTIYSVDPNRIYTRKGRKATLDDGGKYSWRAGRQTKKLAKQILSFIEDDMIIIAMHNNTDINYSIKSYLSGGDEAENTKEVYVSDKMDPDDFIYTTVDSYYNKLRELDINVILQDNEACVNDGSLSVYCGKKGIPYINIEAQKGHLQEQLELIKIVMQVVEGE